MSSTSEHIVATLNMTGKFGALTEIHEGANAYAFKGHHNHLNRDVFLKVYDFVAGMESDVLREPQLLVEAMRGTPSCPNLVQVFDAEIFSTGANQYICLQMEYVQGESLLKRLKNTAVGQQDAVRLVTGIVTSSHVPSP